MRLNAPRGLKLPACCSNSSFSVTGHVRGEIASGRLQHGRMAHKALDAGGGGGDAGSVDRLVSHDCADAGMPRRPVTRRFPFLARCAQIAAHAQPPAPARKLRCKERMMRSSWSVRRDRANPISCCGCFPVALSWSPTIRWTIADGIASCPAELLGLARSTRPRHRAPAVSGAGPAGLDRRTRTTRPIACRCRGVIPTSIFRSSRLDAASASAR